MHFFRAKEVRFIVFSFCAHFLFLYVVWQFIDPYEVDKEKSFRTEVLLEEEYQEKDPQKKEAVNKKAKLKTVKNKKSKKIPLEKLMPNNQFTADNLFKKPESVGKSKGSFENAVFEDLTFYNELWKKLDAKLYYPDVFNALFVSGHASAELVFLPNGTINSHFVNVTSSNLDIQAFVKRLIVESFKEPLNSKFWNKTDKESQLVLNVHFRLISVPDHLPLGKGGVNNKELFFRRTLLNPKAHPVVKALPILGPGGLDIVSTFNILSGRAKKIKKAQKKELFMFRRDNERYIDEQGSI